MAATPFSFTGALQVPGDRGLPQDPIPLNMSSSFTSVNEQVLNLTSAGTMTLPMGTVGNAGLKGLLIKVDANADLSAEPVYVKINAETVGEEVVPGGFKAHGNPAPVAGITSITISWTTPNIVRVWALG
jgi:hypothetical protein